jgi:hypothetical protein
MSGKGSTRRPGTLPVGAWERIFKNPAPSCCDLHAPIDGCNQGRDCPLRKDQFPGVDIDQAHKHGK